MTGPRANTLLVHVVSTLVCALMPRQTLLTHTCASYPAACGLFAVAPPTPPPPIHTLVLRNEQPSSEAGAASQVCIGESCGLLRSIGVVCNVFHHYSAAFAYSYGDCF